MRLFLKVRHKFELVLLKISQLVSAFNDRTKNLVGLRLHGPVNQTVLPRHCIVYLLKFLFCVFFTLYLFYLGRRLLLSSKERLLFRLPFRQLLWGIFRLTFLTVEFNRIIIYLPCRVSLRQFDRESRCRHKLLLGFILSHKNFVRLHTSTRRDRSGHGWWVDISVHGPFNVVNLSPRVDIQIRREKLHIASQFHQNSVKFLSLLFRARE